MPSVPYREYVIKAVEADGSYSFNGKDGAVTVAKYWLTLDDGQRVRFDQLQVKPAPLDGETITGSVDRLENGDFKFKTKKPSQAQTANLELAGINAKLDRIEIMVRQILAKLD